MSDGEHGHGAQLYMSITTDPTNMTAIGNVISITGPNQSRDSIDISSMDSPNNFKEYIPGLLDAGEITVDINYDGSDGGDAAVLGGTNAATGLLKNTNPAMMATIGFFDGTNETGKTNVTNHSFWQANGFITALGHQIPFDTKITQPVTIKLTGTGSFIDSPA